MAYMKKPNGKSYMRLATQEEIDKIKAKPKKEEEQKRWHTGKPTEEGWYFCLVNTGSETRFMANEWKDIVGCQWVYGFHGEIIAWRKAEDPIKILNEASKEE